MDAAPAIAEIVRSGIVEGHHYGAVVALTADGSVEWSVGPVTQPILPRSCNKPLQALAMVKAGLDLPADLLALACASHSGERFHVDGVRRILADAGLDESALRTPRDYPLDSAERDLVLRAGGEASSILMNCSGKHAAMLATCVLRGWSTSDYLDPSHPLQEAILTTFTEMTGEPTSIAVDGCGAPLLSTSLVGLARAFARLAVADAATAEGRIADAIRRHPEMVSGSRRDELRLLRALPGAIAKAGAECCYVVALPDGRTFALKADDGGIRARSVVMSAALGRSGIDDPAVRAIGRTPLFGGGDEVGEIRALL